MFSPSDDRGGRLAKTSTVLSQSVEIDRVEAEVNNDPWIKSMVMLNGGGRYTSGGWWEEL